MRLLAAFLVSTFFALPAAAAENGCAGLPDYSALQTALKAARGEQNGGLNLDMWGTIVSRDGNVCAVAYTGAAYGDQWPGSRIISAQKANTANAFSLKAKALSTANLYSGTQPGGFLFGLQESNPVNIAVAYEGDAETYGTSTDPLVGKKSAASTSLAAALRFTTTRAKLLAVWVSAATLHARTTILHGAAVLL